jgi:hypothetical protein
LSSVDSGLAYAKGVNDAFQDQIKTADQKATYILTLIILMLVWSPDIRQLYFGTGPAQASLHQFALALFVAGALTVALLAALGVVLPRRLSDGQALFWGAWPKAKAEAAGLADKADREVLIATYLDNAGNLAEICRSKYRLVSVAVWALIAAVVGHGVHVVAR